MTSALAYNDVELIKQTVPTRGCEFDTVTSALAYCDVELIMDMYGSAVKNRGREFDAVTNALAYNNAELIKLTCVALQYRPEDVNLTQCRMP